MRKSLSYVLSLAFCVLCLTSFTIRDATAQDWEWADITPGRWNNVDINDISFADDQGWAVGENGAVIHTHNGVRWHDQISGVSKNLYGVHFDSATEGWAVGEHGTILHTKNGGITWAQQVTSTDLYDVHFLDERYGWTVGKWGKILYTDNSGASWDVVIEASYVRDDLHAVYFRSNSSGWAVGENGVILHWNGTDWREQTNPSTVPEDLYGVYFTSASDGWIVGDAGTILHTSDGGSIWASWKSRAPENSINFRSVYFLDEQRQYGWIVGHDSSILYTRDFGGNWWAYNDASAENLNAISASNANEIWAVGNNGGIVRSLDKGQSWGDFANPPYGNFWDVDFDTPLVWTGFGPVPDPRGWIVGDDGIILKLDEDGVNWSEQPYPTAENLYAVHMMDKFNVCAVGEGGVIARTGDGVVWELEEPITQETLRGVYFTKINNGWVVGNNGAIYHWNGTDWENQTSGTRRNLYAVSFVSDTEGWAVGDLGTVLYTNNSGSNWSSVDCGSSKLLRGVSFADSNNGWIVGDDGEIICLHNGEFSEQNSHTTVNLHDVDFVDNLIGWVAGDNRIAVSTPNGGDRWDIHLVAPALGDLYGISFGDQNSGVAVGAGGAIVRYARTTPAAVVEIIVPNGNVTTLSPTFQWNSDKANLEHRIFIDNDSDPFNDPMRIISVSGSTSFTLSEPLEQGVYYWGIELPDGTRSTPEYLEFAVWSPMEVTLVAPSGYISDASPTFHWNCNNEELVQQGFITFTLFIADDGTPYDGTAIPAGGNLSHTLSSTDPLPELPVGQYTWGVQTSGLETVESDIFSITVDLSPPEGSVEIAAGANFTNSLSVALALTASDGDGAGVAEMQFSNDGLDWSDPEVFAATKTWDLSSGGGGSEDGEKTVYARFKDVLGHWATTPASDTITFDTVPPTGSIVVSGGADVIGPDSATLTLSASDDKSGMESDGQMMLSNDGENWSPPLPYQTSRDWTFTVYGGDDKEGVKTVYAKFMDSAGNWMAEAVSDSIELDKTGPTGTILIADGDEFTDLAVVDLSLAAADDNGVQSMQFTNGSGKWSLPEPFSVTRDNWDLSAEEYGGNSNPGEKTVYVRFTDSVGNESAQAASDTITLKTQVSISVEISAPQVAGKIKNGDVVAVEGSSEQGITLAEVVVLDESGKSLNLDLSGVIYDSETGQIIGSFLIGELAAKTIQLGVTVEDVLGNKADATSNILAVDNEPPGGGSVSINQPSPVNYTAVTLSISADGAVEMYAGGDVQYQGAWIPYSETLAVELVSGDGVKTVSMKFRDDMGNESPEASDQIVLDTALPSGGIVVADGAEFTSVFVVSLTLSADDENGVEAYQLSNDGVSWSAEAAIAASEMNVAEWDLREYGGNSNEGTKTVYAKFKDNAGNWSDPASDDILLDTTAPTISFQRVKPKQEATQPVNVTAIVKSDKPLVEVNLHYRRKGQDEYTIVPMTAFPGNYYAAEIPGSEVTLDGVEYYLSAYDGRFIATLPLTNPAVFPHSFTVVDTARPVIEHDPVKESAVKSSPEIVAKVTDAVGVKRVVLFYKPATGRSFVSVDMVIQSIPDEYSAHVPALDLLGIVLYYIEAVDFSDNYRTSPTQGMAQPYAISFVDTESPVIAHTGIADGQEAGAPIVIGATVMDNMAIDVVLLKYNLPDKQESIEAEMVGIGSYYSFEIFGDVVVPGEISYSITASDGSPQSENIEVSHSFTVQDTTPPDISLTFAPAEVEVFQEMSIQAEVTDTVAVESVKLYYKGVGDAAFNDMDMTGTGDNYSAAIAAQEKPGEVQFYIYAEDSYGNSSTEPDVDPQNAPRVIAVNDVSSPAIEHSPLLGTQEAGIAVAVTAVVTDDVEIADVSLHYRTAGDETFKIGSMALLDGTTAEYGGSIPDTAAVLPGVEYYIKAVDGSDNVTTHPAVNPDTMPHSFSVADTVPPEIVYDPAGLATALITEAIVVTVEATDLVGIKGVEVYYRAEDASDFGVLTGKDTGGGKFSAQIPTPPAEGTIYYYIRAEDNSGNVSTSPAEEPTDQPYSIFVDDPFPPLPPTRLTANSASGGKIILAWEASASEDTDKYNIYSDGGSGTVDYSTVYDWTKALSWESPTLGEGVYRFTVRAVDRSGNEEDNTTAVSAKADATKPEPASNVVANSLPDGRIKLEWTLSVSKDAAVYNIYWDNAQLDIIYTSALVRVNDPGIEWTSGKLRDGVVYRFVVRCQDDAGNEEENTDFVSASADSSPPSKPTGLTSTTHQINVWSNQPRVTVRWTPAEDGGTGLAGYSLLWNAFAETLPDDVMNVGDESSVSANLTGTRYLHIRAVDKAGNWSDEAGHLGPFLIDTESPHAPTNLRASSQANGRIRLDWGASESSDVITYNIYGDGGSGSDIDYASRVGTVSGLTWLSAALEDGTTYQFVVRAEDRAGNEETNTKKVSSVADSQPPNIVHKPIAGLLEQEIVSVPVKAVVTDASSLENILLYYRKRGVSNYKETEMTAGANNSYEAEIPAPAFSSAGVDYYISASDEAGNVSKLPVMTIAVGKSVTVAIDATRDNEILMGDGMTLNFPAGAVASNKDLTITIPQVIPEPQKGLGKHIITRELKLDDGLSKSINFTLPYDEDKTAGEDERKLAVYLWDGKRWNFLTGIDAQADQAFVTTMRVGIFSIMGDYEPPNVLDLKPSGYAEADVKLTATLEDNGSGIDPKSITLQMNGETIAVSGTALKGEELSLAFPRLLKPGNYSIRLTVKDNVGNETAAVSGFEVVGELLMEDVYCYPNPFQPTRGVHFAYTLTESVDSVTIRIFGMDGKLAREIEGASSVGKNTVSWDCRDEAGELLLSSVYICRIQAEGAADTATETIKIAGWE